jgi:hypothetical protein
MAAAFHVPDSIREQLRLALVDERDFLEFLAQSLPEAMPDSPGWSRCRGTLTVRRPLDPETFQILQVEARLRPAADGWEVASVLGLEPAESS